MRKQLFSIIIISLAIVGLLVFYLQYKERRMPDKISVFYDNNITIVSKELNKEAISMAFNELNSSVSDADPIIKHYLQIDLKISGNNQDLSSSILIGIILSLLIQRI